MSSNTQLADFKYSDGAPPTGKAVYILHGPFHSGFIVQDGLAIVYRGKSTEVVVAVPLDGVVPPVLIEP